MTTILKLGGSVITDKARPETVDRETLDSVVETVATRYGNGDLVVVHGGGSFGHHHAADHGVSSTDGTHDPAALTAIHAAMTELNDAVVETFHGTGVDAVPVRPLSVAHRHADGGLSLPGGHLAAMLGEGFVPVLHGDVIVQEGRGATVLSGDDIVASLAESLDAARVGLCSTVPGVLDADGAVVPEIDEFGAMAGKVRTLLALDVPASIFDPAALGDFLDGEAVGTTVLGDE